MANLFHWGNGCNIVILFHTLSHFDVTSLQFYIYDPLLESLIAQFEPRFVRSKYIWQTMTRQKNGEVFLMNSYLFTFYV